MVEPKKSDLLALRRTIDTIDQCDKINGGVIDLFKSLASMLIDLNEWRGRDPVHDEAVAEHLAAELKEFYLDCIDPSERFDRETYLRGALEVADAVLIRDSRGTAVEDTEEDARRADLEFEHQLSSQELDEQHKEQAQQVLDDVAIEQHVERQSLRESQEQERQELEDDLQLQKQIDESVRDPETGGWYSVDDSEPSGEEE